MALLDKYMKGRFRVVFDECWKYERPEVKQAERIWYEQIPLYCGGFICLYQEQPTILFKLYTPKSRKLACAIFDRFKDTPGVELDKEFSGWETELIFPPEILLEVGEMAGARKKRRLSPEARAKATERLRAYHLKQKNHAVQPTPTAQIEEKTVNPIPD